MSDWRRAVDEDILDPAVIAAQRKRREENNAAALRVLSRYASRHDWSIDDQTQVQQMLGLAPYKVKPEVKVRRR